MQRPTPTQTIWLLKVMSLYSLKKVIDQAVGAVVTTTSGSELQEHEPPKQRALMGGAEVREDVRILWSSFGMC